MSISIDDIGQLIKSGQSAKVDWFVEQTPVETIGATLAAMANFQGGTVLLGVTGNPGTVVGVRHTADSIDRILQAALSIDPALIVPLPQVIRINGKAIIVVEIPPGMPHVYSLEGRYFQRRDLQNVPLRSRELRRLIIERGDVNFETEAAYNATLNDIDWDKAKVYASSLSGLNEISIEHLLLKRGCLIEEDGKLRPTNAGILLFGKDPQRFIRGADITAARFAGETMSDTFTRQDIIGTLPDQLRRAEMFLVDYLRKGVHLGSTMARAENFEYPMEAARELVVNAVAHRDYHISGDGIRLFIFSDRMEVTSPGGLPGPVTIDNIKDERFSRNPAIVQVLSDMGFIERLGYGVDRVIDLMQQQNLRAPEFAENQGSFRVRLHNQMKDVPPEAEASALTFQFRGFYQGIEINPRQEIALSFLHDPKSSGRITNSDLQALCPDVHPETIRRDLADLVTKGILRKMGQKRGSYYMLRDGDQPESDGDYQDS